MIITYILKGFVTEKKYNGGEESGPCQRTEDVKVTAVSIITALTVILEPYKNRRIGNLNKNKNYPNDSITEMNENTEEGSGILKRFIM